MDIVKVVDFLEVEPESWFPCAASSDICAFFAGAESLVVACGDDGSEGGSNIGDPRVSLIASDLESVCD